MKYLWCIQCVAVYSALAGPIELIDGKYPRFFDFEDEDGNIHKVDLLEPVDNELLSEIQRNPANNQYLLYTRRNPTSHQSLIMNNANSITSSNFNPRQPTVVISHGWLGNIINLNPVIRDAYLRREETNVIVLDWRRLALAPYPTAARGVPDIERGLGQFLNFLHRTTGAPFNTMHLIGFSLGGHVVGNAGRYSAVGLLVSLVSLDPAGPLWRNNDQRVRPTDGVYVEAIHTNGGLAGIGIGMAVAHADFFPNGGKSQPGCYTPICDHNRAWEFFAATIPRNHLVGRRCNNMQEVDRNNCSGATLNLGNIYLNKRGSGIYRVNTGRRYPF